jgi:proline iminopeptidase
MAVLGHSWGGLLAMEYATRHPDRVTHLILADTAPASAADWQAFREELVRIPPPGDVEQMQALAAGSRYLEGDLEAEADYYRIYFRVTLRQPALLEELVGRLRAYFTEESVLLARAIAQRLFDGTWRSDTYDLMPRLRALDVPTLVLHGAHDFIPVAVAERIAETLPRGELTVLPECGHFTYLEQPDAVHRHVAALLKSE